MQGRIDRRGFLKHAGGVAAGTSLLGLGVGSSSWAAPPAECAPSAKKLGWTMCCQLFTLRRHNFFEALPVAASLGVKYVEGVYFLRLDQDHPQLKTSAEASKRLQEKMKRQLAASNLEMIGYYADLQNDEPAARQTFEFAKTMGCRMLVSEPAVDAFDMLEELCEEFQIDLAIHNHPEEFGSIYWRPEVVLDVCRGRGKRIGACCDTGHWIRSGLKPVECLKKMEGHITTVHLKDIGQWGDPKGRDVPLGKGVGDYTAVLTELHRQGFRGVLTVEYEHDSPKLLDEVAECITFVEQTAQSLLG